MKNMVLTVSQDQVEQMGLEYADTLEQAIQRINIPNPEILIFPKAAVTLPYLF